MTFYKIWTHDFCSPLQGGKPVFDGTLPFTLPKVILDSSEEKCAAGWNFTDNLAKGFEIAGMWPNGRPSAVTIIEPSEDLIYRGGKWRASGGKLVRFATEVEVAQAIEQFSAVFGELKSDMAHEQIQWRHALGRPERNEAAVVEALEKALALRGLTEWTVKKHGDAGDAGDAWAARAARAAWAARDALILFYTSKKKWIESPANLLTDGWREAYTNGLEVALPTSPKTLGYTMMKGPQ